MRITVNPKAEGSGDFGYVAPGEYTLRIVKVEQKMKADGEYPYLKWELELADPNIQTVDRTKDGNSKRAGHIFENTTLKPEAQFRLRDLCEALGLTWGDFDTDQTIGMTFNAKLTTKEYAGVISNEVAKYVK